MAAWFARNRGRDKPRAHRRQVVLDQVPIEGHTRGMALDPMPGSSLPSSSLSNSAASTRQLGERMKTEAREPRISGKAFWLAMAVIVLVLALFAWLLS
jgi:hypothetical protein